MQQLSFILFQNRIEQVNITNVRVYLWGQVARLTMGREKMFYLQKPKLLATLKGDVQPDLTSFCLQTYFAQHAGRIFACSRLQIKYSCQVKNRTCQIRPTKIHSSMPNWCFFHQSDKEKIVINNHSAAFSSTKPHVFLVGTHYQYSKSVRTGVSNCAPY